MIKSVDLFKISYNGMINICNTVYIITDLFYGVIYGMIKLTVSFSILVIKFEVEVPHDEAYMFPTEELSLTSSRDEQLLLSVIYIKILSNIQYI